MSHPPPPRERAIREARLEGRTPFLLVAMAGTTGTGARGQSELAGIERADSIVVDPHKSLFLPFGTGCILARREDDLRRAHLVHSHCIRESVELGARACATNPPVTTTRPPSMARPSS